MQRRLTLKKQAGSQEEQEAGIREGRKDFLLKNIFELQALVA